MKALTFWVGMWAVGVALVVFCAASAYGQQGPQPEKGARSEKGGRIRQGSFLLAGNERGRLILFMGDEPLLNDCGIGCGYRGYTRSDAFAARKLEKGDGTLRFSGSLEGAPVTFEQNVSIEGGRIHVELRRRGPWPADAGWCSLQLLLPISRYGRAQYRADGVVSRYPEQLIGDGNILGNIRRLECNLDSAALNLVLECPTGLILQDMRRWQGESFQVGIGFPAGDDVRADLYLTLPWTLEGLPQPRLCRSQIGYPAKGMKFVVLEWPKGSAPPDDGVRLEKDGAVVKEGRFTPAADYDYMQSSFGVFDFSDVRAPGTYRVVWSGGTEDVSVRESVFEDRLWEPTLDYFIPWEMCHAAADLGKDVPQTSACHMDDAVRVPAHFPGVDGFVSYECEGTPYKDGDRIPCAKGGWHDAGDYDLNVHAQGFVVWTLALAYEEFGIQRDVATLDADAQRFVLGKPDGMPDIVQQIEWGALWLLSMEQPDGRVYVGVIDQPSRNNASIAPEKDTDNVPGTGDERQVYVDYNSDMQLVQAISLAAARRALKQHRPELSARCLEAARKAFAYFQGRPEVYRPASYFSTTPENGRDGMVLAAAIELYLTTKDPDYLHYIQGMSDAIPKLPLTWPAAYSTQQGNFWYAPPFLARLHPLLADGELRDRVRDACQRAAETQVQLSSPRPWPFFWWHLQDWGSNGYCLSRVFDSYYLERVVPATSPLSGGDAQHAVPGAFTVDESVRDMLWVFGLHPLSDVVFVCDIGYPGPRYLYNGRLHGRFGAKPASVPGAVVPGMGGVPDAGMIVYDDRPGNYYHNEACIYTAASYIFAVNALKHAGY